jgi:hypothetical protein
MGCVEQNEPEAHIAVQLWADRYIPSVNFSDIYSGGLPEVSIAYRHAGEGIYNASIGEQVFISYRVYMDNVVSFLGKAHCQVNGEFLSPFDVNLKYLPTQYEQAVQFGLPVPVTDQKDIDAETVYSFSWPYRFSYYGLHHITCYLKSPDGIVHAQIERNISILPANPNDNRWALIISVDPIGDSIASWKDSIMAWSVLTEQYNYPASHVLCLSNGIATRDNVLDTMAWLAKQTTQDTILVCWISAHGGIELFGDEDSEIRDGYIQLWDDRLFDGDLATFFAETKSLHILSVVDTCFAGEFGGPDDLERVFTQIRGEHSIEESGRVLMTAATTFTRSKATENGGIFTILMSGALLGIKDITGTTADDFPYGDDNGRISAEEAGYWAAFHCYSHPGYGYPQLNDLHTGDLYLTS